MLLSADGCTPDTGPANPPAIELDAADADGDGRLGLADVKTSSRAAPQPTSLTFNGRGIDLNGGGYWIVINRDTGIIDSAAEGGDFTIAYEPVWAIGTGRAQCGPPVKADGAVSCMIGIHNSTSDSGSGAGIEPAELPIIMDVLGSTRDFQLDGGRADPVGQSEPGTQNTGEPTSLTFNGRGIDLSAEGRIEPMGTDDPLPVFLTPENNPL